MVRSLPGARSVNERMVLDLLAEHGPATRPWLAAEVGITRPAMLELVNRLLDEGLIEEAGVKRADRPGPSSVSYAVRKDLGLAMGIEMHPTRASAAVAAIDGTVIARGSVEGDERSPAELLTDLLASASARAQVPVSVSAIAGAVIGAPGIIDAAGDTSYVAGYPRWHVERDKLRRILDAPIRVENDVNLAAVAEHAAGQGIPDTFVLLKCDEGAGAALVLSGSLVRGQRGAAGEIGCLPLEPIAPLAEENLDDNYTRHASIDSLRAFLASNGSDNLDPVAILNGPPTDNMRTLLLAEAARRIAFGVIAMCAVLDPGYVILTGAIAAAGGQDLADAVAAHANQRLPTPVTVRPTALNTDAVVDGALTTALGLARDELFGRVADHRLTRPLVRF